MSIELNEKELYNLQHYAANEPRKFAHDYVQSSRKLKHHSQGLLQLTMAKAHLILGETRQAQSVLADLKTSLPKQKDSLFLGAYYIMLYNFTVATGGSNSQAEEYFKLAEKQAKQYGSKALSCELKNLICQKPGKDISMDAKEELLKEAMVEALESDILDLQLEVHLSYCILYLQRNLPDLANQELILLYDLVEKERNPKYYTFILLYFGIVNLMLKNLPKAYKYLSDGIDWATKNDNRSLLIPLNINLGLYYVNSGNLEQGIDIYYYSLKLSDEFGLENSLNAHITQNNLAIALGKLSRIDEAVQINRNSIDSAIKSNNALREHTQYVNLADNLIELKAYNEAEQHINKAIAYFTDIQENHHLTFAYRCKARLFEEQEKYQEGFEALEMLDNTYQIYFRENFSKQNALYQDRIDKLRSEYLRLKNQCNTESELIRLSSSTDFIGEHSSIKKALKDAYLAARYPYTHVMITGESGTGKEVIARIIHNESKTGKPLVAINASAISPNLIESELFGHKRGAFTGAMEDRKGKFLMADKGTLLLDEISDMPVEAQVKLLRAIEEHTIQPVGSDKKIPVNCRIICTSNKNISTLIHNNKFRLDLYHRLNKVEIYLVPLRERLSDLEMITHFFVERYSREFRLPIPILSDSFYNRLRAYSFPGNVRELANLIERIFILKPSAQWDARMLDGILPDTPTSELPAFKAVSHHLKDTETKMIVEALNRCDGMQKEAAKLLNMSESTLSRHIKKLKISR
ncbi:MAG: sigma-54 dependent transcriptional regulator [Candidatus Cloacimonadaceae bacterium]|nr:sigma-54 dependent transcriptional regulator [Candidatus Cloacimonadaceae bacterium]